MRDAMINLAFILTLALTFSASVAAGSTNYQCTVLDLYKLDNLGKLFRLQSITGFRFAVDRRTGFMIGTETLAISLNSMPEDKIEVLATGDEGKNVFVVTITPPKLEIGKSVTVLTVREWMPTARKQFLISSGTTVASGICE